MFEVIYHEAAEDELRSLPPIIRVKFVKLVNRLQTDPCSLREPHTNHWEMGCMRLERLVAISHADFGCISEDRKFTCCVFSLRRVKKCHHLK